MKNTTIKSTAVQIEYESDKLEALRVYLNDKNSTVEQEMLETLDSIYKKVVPTQVRVGVAHFFTQERNFMKSKNTNECLISKTLRFREDQWQDSEEFAKKLGLKSPNHFIRDAVDFYLEYLKNNNSRRFLTPALESVIASKVKDSEDRIARMLFKLTVDVNLLAHVVADTYKFNLDALDKLRIDSIREVKETNGTLTANDIFRRK